MPDLKVDLETPNRFISSLSKSLQALCHGCMEFDNGIEIFGYINVNIDSGNKMDYVLNEKVMKSNTNSMTFVSNSFVAIKDQPKQKIDGSCSPIPELQLEPQSFHNTQNFPNQTASYPHSSSSQVLQGARKRVWSGMDRDWRGSPQKHPSPKHSRRGRPTYARVHNPHQPPESQLSSHPYGAFESTVSQTQVPGSQSSIESSCVSVKQELMPHDDNGGEVKNSEQFSESTGASSGGADVNVNIKSEPDSLPLITFDTTNVTGEDSKSNIDSKSDVHGNFLEGDETSSAAEQSQSTNQTGNEFSSLGNDFPSSAHREGNVAMSDNSQAPAVEYDETQGDLSLPGTSFAGEGDESSHFDIIEIGDEDDGADMYQDAQEHFDATSIRRNLQHQPSNPASNSFIKPAHLRDDKYWSMHMSQNISPQTSSDSPIYARLRDDSMPFSCNICGKGYMTHPGLRKHLIKHTGVQFACPICDRKFTEIYNMKTHLKTQHGCAQCSKCLKCFSLGDSFNKHLFQCDNEYCEEIRN